MKHTIGTGVEAEYGTAVAPDQWHEFNNQSLQTEKIVGQSDGIHGSSRAVARAIRRRKIRTVAAGAINLDLEPDVIGRYLQHALGAVASSQPDDVGAPSVWEHTFTLGSLAGLSLTAQAGIQQQDGTVDPVTLVGGKVLGVQIGVDRDELGKLTVDLDFKDEDTGETLEPPAVSEAPLLDFAGASLTLEASQVAGVTRARTDVTNNLKTDDVFMAAGKVEPTESDDPDLAGEFVARFHGRDALYDSYLADSGLAYVQRWVGPEIEGGLNYELQITIPEVRLEGDTPTISNSEVPDVTVPFTGLQPEGGGEPITVLLRNAVETL